MMLYFFLLIFCWFSNSASDCLERLVSRITCNVYYPTSSKPSGHG